MKKTIMRGILALAAAAVMLVGCNNDPTTKYETVPKDPDSQGPAQQIVNPVEDVQLTIEAKEWGFQLSWPPVKNAGSYKVWRHTGNEPDYELPGVAVSANRMIVVNDIVQILNDKPTLEAEKTYVYRVSAITNSGLDSQRDLSTVTMDKAASADLWDKDTEFPKPVVSLRSDGANQKFILTLTPPSNADFPYPATGLSINWSVKKGGADVGSGSSTTFNGAAQDFDVAIADWTKVDGDYTATATYGGTIINYFKGAAADPFPYTYGRLFDFAFDKDPGNKLDFTATAEWIFFDERTHSSDFDITSDAGQTTTSDSVLGYQGRLDLSKVRGKPGVTYTIWRREGAVGATALTSAYTQLTDNYTGTATSYQPAALHIAKAWVADGDNTAGALPAGFDSNVRGTTTNPYTALRKGATGLFATSASALFYNGGLVPDAMGLLAQGPVFDRTLPIKQATYQYKVQAVGPGGSIDVIESNIVEVSADAAGYANYPKQLIVAKGSGDQDLTVTLNVAGMQDATDYVEVFWALTGDNNNSGPKFSTGKDSIFGLPQYAKIPVASFSALGNDNAATWDDSGVSMSGSSGPEFKKVTSMAMTDLTSYLTKANASGAALKDYGYTRVLVKVQGQVDGKQLQMVGWTEDMDNSVTTPSGLLIWDKSDSSTFTPSGTALKVININGLTYLEKPLS